ncbi:hypothetical protein [Laspinema sp. D2d]|nr:hypothetical protein [Laspinema sp. D2d]
MWRSPHNVLLEAIAPGGWSNLFFRKAGSHVTTDTLHPPISRDAR